MTKYKLPVSTTQAIVGAIIGGVILRTSVNYDVLKKIVGTWVFGPVLGAVFPRFYIYYYENLFATPVSIY